MNNTIKQLFAVEYSGNPIVTRLLQHCNHIVTCGIMLFMQFSINQLLFIDSTGINSKMKSDMASSSGNKANIEFTVKKIKLLRSGVFTAIIILFMIINSAENLIVLLSMTAGYSIVAIFHGYCVLSRKQHLLNSAVLILPELIISNAFLLFINPGLLLPFTCLQTVELAVENRGLKYIYALAGTAAAGMAAGFIIRNEQKFIIYTIPAILIVILIFKLIHLQDFRNKNKYEYMKKLVDNKNKLLSTLTHELRTPLAVIKTSNELIMEERPGPINETQRTLIFSSLENTKRLNSLVENILSQVKVEFAWFSMKQQPLDIRNLIRKTAVDINPYLETKKQQLKYNYPSLMSKTIGDKRWLEQVLLNLIHNGSKNSPDNSEITISVQENEQCIVISVHDRGSGIKSREIPNVFNEFYQSTDPAKNLNEGAGLGLTIVRDIIEKHKGEVYISSLPQTGTTVSFTLPIYKGVFL